MKKWLFLSLCLTAFIAKADPIPATDAFQLNVNKADDHTFSLNWTIQPGYYLYKERISLIPDSEKVVELGNIHFPKSITKTDKQGHTSSIYKHQLSIPIHIDGKAAGETILQLSYQGCAESGFCYPPIKKSVHVLINDQMALDKISLAPLQSPSVKHSPPAENGSIGHIFAAHHWPVILLIFFGLGLLLSFTPCILPMIPVLSGIIVGHGKDVTTKKAFLLSLSYVLSMSVTYAIVGAIVAMLGANIQISMQSPWTIGLFSLLFVLLALSMFDFYEFKLPQSWQTKIAGTSGQQRRGHYWGAAIMGSLSTLILSPCVTAPLIGVLSYIAQTKNVLFGSIILFILSLGMGTPLLLIGTSAGKWLPKVGPWMNSVKAFFGVMLLAIAIYLMARILPDSFTMGLWALLLIFSGIYSGALTPSFSNQDKFYQGVGIIALGYGLLILVGLSMGGTNPLMPLSNLQAKSVAVTAPTNAQGVSLDTLKKTIQKAHGKPVMLDFYADWCTSCKYMEATTFQDERVKKALSAFKTIKINVTANNDQDKELMSYFKVIAPPTFVFFNSKGELLEELKIVGEQSADEFLGILNKVL